MAMKQTKTIQQFEEQMRWHKKTREERKDKEKKWDVGVTPKL